MKNTKCFLSVGIALAIVLCSSVQLLTINQEPQIVHHGDIANLQIAIDRLNRKIIFLEELLIRKKIVTKEELPEL